MKILEVRYCGLRCVVFYSPVDGAEIRLPLETITGLHPIVHFNRNFNAPTIMPAVRKHDDEGWPMRDFQVVDGKMIFLDTDEWHYLPEITPAQMKQWEPMILPQPPTDSAYLRRFIDNGGQLRGYMFWCPGCKCGHWYDTKRWEFNNNFIKPTFRPSLLCTSSDAGRPTCCHLFLTDGVLQYLGDCTHFLRGRKIPLSPFFA